ncbi:MAG: DUF2236 domain-containing protein [Acidobacteria bacterium]|nr:DUF2236 domain-containing protein [Acidobacteriota bacterium]
MSRDRDDGREPASRWDALRSHLLTAFSGTETGRPYWVDEIELGDDAGYFGEGSAAWEVHGGLATLVAGIRALLMQTLHPGAMAGVHDWSRYQEDPLGRLSGTIRWLVGVTFGSTEYARVESARVARFHDRVVGTYLDRDGNEVPYAAGDPELLAWVHLAFTEAFLGAHEVWGGPIPGGADQYVDEWAKAAELVGAPNPPHSAAELRAQLETFRTDGTLRRDARVDEAVRFIRNPPLGKGFGPAYRILFAGAVASIPVEYRRLLGLRRAWWPATTLTRIVLRIVHRALGSSSSSEDAARARLARLAAADAA